MSSTLLPFLYQTRTLQRACRLPVSHVFIRNAYKARKINDNSIPFEFGQSEKQDGFDDIEVDDSSTITPSEAEVFKSIFEDIAKGKLQKARNHSRATKSSRATLDALKQSDSKRQPRTSGTGSIVDQVRVAEVREQFLERYPRSLRKAAEMALGKFELEPQRPRVREEMPELDEAERNRMAEWSRYEEIRMGEMARVDSLMGKCQTDIELWTVMEQEVFSLPKKLGIVRETKTPKRGRKSKKEAVKIEGDNDTEESLEADAEATSDDDDLRIMDVHGPLYSHFLNTALHMLDTAFTRPSPLAFQILPRVKELGLPSYVLGVTTSFYAKLAEMHWNRFGDANSALDALQEMYALGLQANKDVVDLLARIRDELHCCTWGAQGPFVMAMMETPPYDAALVERLEHVEVKLLQN